MCPLTAALSMVSLDTRISPSHVVLRSAPDALIGARGRARCASAPGMRMNGSSKRMRSRAGGTSRPRTSRADDVYWFVSIAWQVLTCCRLTGFRCVPAHETQKHCTGFATLQQVLSRPSAWAQGGRPSLQAPGSRRKEGEGLWALRGWAGRPRSARRTGPALARAPTPSDDARAMVLG
jgi:hypothetical protein